MALYNACLCLLSHGCDPSLTGSDVGEKGFIGTQPFMVEKDGGRSYRVCSEG